MIQENEGNQGSLDVQYTCRCSFLQIYQENISDLLRPHPAHNGHSLPLRSSPESGVFVEGLTEHVIVNGAPPHSPTSVPLAFHCLHDTADAVEISAYGFLCAELVPVREDAVTSDVSPRRGAIHVLLSLSIRCL